MQLSGFSVGENERTVHVSYNQLTLKCTTFSTENLLLDLLPTKQRITCKKGKTCWTRDGLPKKEQWGLGKFSQTMLGL